MLSFLNNENKSYCCGCRACEQVCCHKAIKMEKDEEGFLYPTINKEKCTHCDLCKKICPYNNISSEQSTTPQAYWGWAKDENIRLSSSSGGIFTIIASIIIAKQGVVYGAHLDKQWNIYHTKVNQIQALSLLRGSKYAQSDTLQTYSSIKTELQKGIWVYFCGTPCQIAGLKSYLKKNYPRLITTDLICHGVSSNNLLKQHIKQIEEKKHIKIFEYSCRNPKCWYQFESYKYTKKGKEYQYDLPTPYLSSYYNAYLGSMTYRPSCYVCPYAQIPRMGDITLGDFWGVHNYYKNISNTKGVSLLLCNTSKGKALLKDIMQEAYINKCKLENVIQHNLCLIKPSIKPPQRDNIYQTIAKMGYSRTAKKKI
jgi:NADPH:quinone reductase